MLDDHHLTATPLKYLTTYKEPRARSISARGKRDLGSCNVLFPLSSGKRPDQLTCGLLVDNLCITLLITPISMISRARICAHSPGL